jgi:hypothetical protein
MMFLDYCLSITRISCCIDAVGNVNIGIGAGTTFAEVEQHRIIFVRRSNRIQRNKIMVPSTPKVQQTIMSVIL